MRVLEKKQEQQREEQEQFRLEREALTSQLEDAHKLLEMQQIDIDAARLELVATQERARTAEAEAIDVGADAAERHLGFFEVMTASNEMLKQELAEAKKQLAEANKLDEQQKELEQAKQDHEAVLQQLSDANKLAEQHQIDINAAQAALDAARSELAATQESMRVAEAKTIQNIMSTQHH